MFGGRHRLLREGAQEERLFAPGADLSERARGTDEAVILEFGLFGRGDLKGRGRRRPGLRLAEAFERELAVELVVMLRSVREIRSEESRVGIVCDRTCRSRWSPYT